jgi:hypothetical protein
VLSHNCGFFCTGVRQSPSNSDDLHGQVQQLTRQHFLAYLTVLEAKYVHCTPHSFVLFFIIPYLL